MKMHGMDESCEIQELSRSGVLHCLEYKIGPLDFHKNILGCLTLLQRLTEVGSFLKILEITDEVKIKKERTVSTKISKRQALEGLPATSSDKPLLHTISYLDYPAWICASYSIYQLYFFILNMYCMRDWKEQRSCSYPKKLVASEIQPQLLTIALCITHYANKGHVTPRYLTRSFTLWAHHVSAWLPKFLLGHTYPAHVYV